MWRRVAAVSSKGRVTFSRSVRSSYEYLRPIVFDGCSGLAPNNCCASYMYCNLNLNSHVSLQPESCLTPGEEQLVYHKHTLSNRLNRAVLPDGYLFYFVGTLLHDYIFRATFTAVNLRPGPLLADFRA